MSDIPIGDGAPLVLIAGPCVVEDWETILSTATTIQQICTRYGLPFIFKSSYRKANRTSKDSFSSIGDDEALSILLKVKKELGIPILTDIHSPEEAIPASEVVDIIQIPAFLCRQTALLEAAGRTMKAVNVKKGQFLSPYEMTQVSQKIASTGNNRILLTERGTTFGYNNLVVDMRSLEIMKRSGYPVVMDATHSIQLPGGNLKESGGQPEFIFPIARAAVAVGCDALFVETHPDPARSLSDAASQLKLSLLEDLIKQVIAIDKITKEMVVSSAHH